MQQRQITKANHATAAVINALRAREYAAYRYGGYDHTREEYETKLDAVRIALTDIKR